MDEELINNPDAEKAVLGGILIDQSVIDSVRTTIKPEYFYFEHHRRMFEALLCLHEKGASIDPVTLPGQMQVDGTLEPIGGIGYIMDCFSSVPTAGNIEHHAGLVKKYALQRKLYKLLKEKSELIQSVPVDDVADLDTILNSIETEFRSGVLESSDYIDYNQGYEKLLEEGEEPRGLLTGYSDLDKHIDMRPGQIWVLYGDTGHRKTTFAMNLAVRWAKEVPVAFYSYEMPPESLIHWASLVKRENEVIDSERLIFCEKAPTLETMISHIKNMKAKKGLQVVVIDYLQIMTTDNQRYYREEVDRVIYFLQEIKKVALHEKISFLILSQMRKREGDTSKHSLDPIVDRIRGSGEIRNAAHVIISVVAPLKIGFDYYDDASTRNMLVLRIKKNRDCLTDNPGEEIPYKLYTVPQSRRITSMYV